MGDLNMYDVRYELGNSTFTSYIPSPQRPQMKVYDMFHKMLPTEMYRHLFSGEPTQEPYQADADNAAQLDYMIHFHRGIFPKENQKHGQQSPITKHLCTF